MSGPISTPSAGWQRRRRRPPNPSSDPTRYLWPFLANVLSFPGASFHGKQVEGAAGSLVGNATPQRVSAPLLEFPVWRRKQSKRNWELLHALGQQFTSAVVHSDFRCGTMWRTGSGIGERVRVTSRPRPR